MGGRFRKLISAFGISTALFLVAAPAMAQDAASTPVNGFIVSSLYSLAGLTCTSGGPVPIPCPARAAAEALQSIDQMVLKPVVEGALLFTVLDFVSNVLDRTAYEAAVAISSAGKGQTPLIVTDPPEFAGQALNEVIGFALDGLNDFTKNGAGIRLDICDPSLLAPTLRLNLSLGIKQAYQPVRPKCDATKVVQNWSNFVSTTVGSATDPDAARKVILQQFAQSLRPGQNELGLAVDISFSTNEAYNIKTNLNIQQMLANGGFKDQVDFVTGQVTTPASVLREKFIQDTVRTPVEQRQSYLQAAIQNPEFLAAYLTRSLSIFTNTLLSQGTTDIYNGLLQPPLPPTDPFNVDANALTGRSQAQQAFAGLITARPQTVTNYNALAEFVTCPSGSAVPRNVNNCVMDQSFLSAVSRANGDQPLTVQEAISQQFIRGDWPLIPPTDEAKNQDPFCYSYGFCYGNLVKMRKARILPIGWEIAARLNTSTPPATLDDIIAGFDDCETGGKWCHLIDPNWVLKYPETQCKALVNGEILATNASSARAGYCADAPSCVAQDGNGNCIGGYGYCVREKNTWKFRGDSCPADFASCFAFTNTATNEQVGYLLNTVNYDGCSADNAGCTWYRKDKFPEAGSFTFLPASQIPYVVATHDQEHEDRVYLNGKVESCSASDAGCSALLRAAGLTLNVVKNPSVEDDADNNARPDGWTLGSGVSYSTSGNAFTGSDTITVSSGANGTASQSGIFLGKDSFYTVSLYGRNAATATVDIVLVNATTGAPANIGGTSVKAILTGTGSGSCAVVAADTVRLVTNPFSTSFDRQGCAFTVNADMLATVRVSANASLVVDAVQLERGELMTSFAGNGYGSTQLASFAANLKVPPAYLNCRGLATDPAECGSFAPVCAAQDVGCNLYTPDDGDPSIPAVTSVLDRCPNECVGYAAFKQEATKYELARFPVNLIPSTADICSANDAGCDAFTNIDTLAAGGEGIEHYTDLRACVTNAGADASNGNATFYTWEGSDVQGFQLRTWTLLRAPNGSPCTAWHMGSANSLICDGSPDPGPTCDDHADTLTNLDCREFYDASGVIHYREFSKTVTISDQCHPYRKTDPGTQADCTASGGFFETSGECRYFGLPEESRSCPAAASGCRLYTGSAGNNVTTIFNETFENGAASATTFEAGPGVSATVSNDAISAGGHSLRIAGATSGNGVSTAYSEAAGTGPLVGKLVAGKTFLVSFFAKGTGRIDVSFKDNGGAGATHGIQNGLLLDTAWKQYSIGPIDSTAFGAGFDDKAVVAFVRSATNGAADFNLDNVLIRQVSSSIALVKNSWNTPASCDTAPSGVNSPQYYLGCKAYTDKQGVQGSFFQFSHLCSEQVVGCQAFYDTKNSTSPYGKTFQARCAGTPNSDCTLAGKTCRIAPGKDFCLVDVDETFALTSAVLGPETQVVYNDSPVFLVDDGSDSCSAAAVGCMEVGLPKFNQDKTVVESFTSAYVVNRPDDYDTILCAHEELYCAEWKSSSQGNFYFKDPIDQTCELKDEVTIDGVRYNGWFQAGTKNPCSYTDLNGNKQWETSEPASIAGGDTALILKNGDADYLDLNDNGWYGTCETRYDQCTEFRDPSDTQNGRVPQGTSYFFLNNERVQNPPAGSTACEGRVAQKLGCALFNDASKTGTTLASSPTYVSSNHADVLYGEAAFGLVDPIDCSGTGDGGLITPPGANAQAVNLCAQRCMYDVGSENLIVGNAARDNAAGVEYFGSCLIDDDCTDQAGTDDQLYKGSCVTLAQNQFSLWNKNDSNTVLRVQPDRQCAEWLACSSSQVSWDQSVGRFRSICDQVSLCDAFSATGDESFCASFASSAPIKLTDGVYRDRDVTWSGLEYSGYAIPDALPVDLYDQVNVRPDRWCSRNGQPLPGPDGFGIRCFNTDQCDQILSGSECVDAPQDIRLAFIAGSCRETTVGFGGECKVGFCRTSGTSCAADVECEGGAGDDCVFGFCQGTSATSCSTDTQCALATAGGLSAPYCDVRAGRCVTMRESELDSAPFTDCATATSCGAGQRCVQPSRVVDGACFSDQCTTTVQGQRLAAPDDAAPLSCRGYPEATSPFKTTVITQWSPVLGSSDIDDMPQANAPGSSSFVLPNSSSQTNVCAPVWKYDPAAGEKTWQASEDCVCSYDKLTYGDGLAAAYYRRGTETGNLRTSISDPDEAPGSICSAGPRSGQPCVSDDECENGECLAVTRRESFFGYDGYCLEKDSSIQLFNSPLPADRACLTWYPTEQLAGSTNLFAKFETAGFAGDAFYCAETDAYYKLTTSPMACAEDVGLNNSCNGSNHLYTDTNSTKSDENECLGSIYCPVGFFAVMAPSNDNRGDAPAVDHSGACPNKGGNVCPYFCVPENSVKSSGDLCSPPGVGAEQIRHIDNGQSCLEDDAGCYPDEGYIINFDAYVVARTTFNDYLANGTFADCVRDGLSRTEMEAAMGQGNWIQNVNNVPVDGKATLLSEMTAYPGCSGAFDSYTNLVLQAEPYFACKTVAQVSRNSLTPEQSNYNFAWTDRTWIGKSPSRYTIKPTTVLGTVFADPAVQSNTLTEVTPFGQATDPEAFVEDAANKRSPELVAQCRNPELTMTIRGTSSNGTASDQNDYPVNDIRLIPFNATECSAPFVPSVGAEDGLDARSFDSIQFIPATTIFSPEGGPGIVKRCPELRNQTQTTCNTGIACTSGQCSSGPRRGQSCTSTAQCQGLICTPTADAQGNATGGEPLVGSDRVCVTADDAVYDEANAFVSPTATAAVMRLRQIFAKTLQLFPFTNQDAGYTPGDTDVRSPRNPLFWDVTVTGDIGVAAPERPVPPVVMSVGDCVGTMCKEGDADGFSVNGQDSGIVIGTERKHVSANFYTFADEEQLPIRKIIVDWGSSRDYVTSTDWHPGSQSGSTTNDNFYKNHRGLKPGGNTATPFCPGTGDELTKGTSAESCESSYVTFTHDYVCSQAFVDRMESSAPTRLCRLNEDGNLMNSPCTGGEVPAAAGKCVFQPRVHVKDNWGWCTGTCEENNSGDSSPGCYADECSTQFPNGDFPENDPWVYFSGFVVVDPSTPSQ